MTDPRTNPDWQLSQETAERITKEWPKAFGKPDHVRALAGALRRISKVGGSEAEAHMRRLAKAALRTYDAHPAEAATRENGTSALEKICAAIVADPQPLSGTKLIERIYQIASTALSTHQQQGADREVMKTALCVLRGIENSGDPYLALHPNMRKDVVIAIDGLRDALSRAPQPIPPHATEAWIVKLDELWIRDTDTSPGGSQLANIINRVIEAAPRAPQPDTVTEEMRQAAFNELAARQHAAISKEGRILDATETVDVILTAALTARGKV